MVPVRAAPGQRCRPVAPAARTARRMRAFTHVTNARSSWVRSARSCPLVWARAISRPPRSCRVAIESPPPGPVERKPAMRAFTLDSLDAPPRLREDVRGPEPGPDQLLVRVQASSVNPVDAAIAGGFLKGVLDYEFPVTLGRDYAGVVERVGSAVSGYAVGDMVFGSLAFAPPLHAGPWAGLV